MQEFDWDYDGDYVYSARGTGPSQCYTHFIITLTAKKPWLLTSFSMQLGANEDQYYPTYKVDIFAAQGKDQYLLGTVTVNYNSLTAVSLSELNCVLAAGPMQILILPQISSPTGSGYLAVDDITIMGKWNQ